MFMAQITRLDVDKLAEVGHGTIAEELYELEREIEERCLRSRYGEGAPPRKDQWDRLDALRAAIGLDE